MNGPLIQRDDRSRRIEPSSPAVPSRLISRIACDFILAISAEGVRRHGSLRRSIVLTAIVVANVEHITRSAVRSWRYAGQDQIPPDSQRRPVSILSLSQSLRTPFETTRENVQALVRDGLCVKTAEGVIVPSEALLSDKVAKSEAFLWEAFLAMIARLRSLDFDFGIVLGDAAPPGPIDAETRFDAPLIDATLATQPPRRIVARVISQFYITVAVEGNEQQGFDWAMGLIWITMVSINSAAWSLEYEQAWRYARIDTPPPDALRTPASIADIARLTGLGEASVRRKVKILADAGCAVRKDGGFLASMDYIQGPQNQGGTAVIVKAFYRMIYDLTALGVRL